MTLTEWLNLHNNNAGADYASLLNSGLVSPLTSPEWSFTGNPGDSGDPMGYSLTPEAQQRLAGYSVNQTSQDPNNTFYDVLGSSGSKVGDVSTPIDKDSWLDTIGYSGLPVLGLAGLGMFGPGGLLTGGAEAAGAASGAGGSSVNAALAELVGGGPQSMAFGNMASPAVAGALGDLVGMSLPTVTQTVGASAGLAGLGSLFGPVLGNAMSNIPPTNIDPTQAAADVAKETLPKVSDTLPSVPPVVAGAGSSIPDWLKDNGKWLAPLLGGAVGLLGGDPKSSGGYTDSGYRPTITRGGWSPSASTAPTVTPNIGLLNIPTTGVENAGLWRFLGGK